MDTPDGVPSSRPSLRHLLNPTNLALREGIKQRAETGPLWQVMDWAVRALNIRIDVKRDYVPDTGPLLVVGNDPSPMAGFVFISLIRREDSHFVGAPGWTKQGRITAERCLPVFTTARFSENLKVAFRARFLYPRLYGVKPGEVGRRNVAALARASRLLNDGASVLILPAGGTIAESDNWKHGIGRVIKQTGDVPVQVVMANLRGTRPPDAIRLLNPYWFRGTRKPLAVSVEFSEPMPLSDFRAGDMQARDISLRVRDRYIQVFGSL